VTYAAATSVSVEKSRAELEELLRRAGAQKRAVGVDEERGQATIFFVLAARQVRLSIALPTIETYRFTTWRGRQVSCSGDEQRRRWEQACRTRWRAMVLLVRAKLEAVALGLTTIEHEFLADILLFDGRRVGEAAAPQLESQYGQGTSSFMLPLMTEEKE
jgi:hypothetical protein